MTDFRPRQTVNKLVSPPPFPIDRQALTDLVINSSQQCHRDEGPEKGPKDNRELLEDQTAITLDRCCRRKLGLI